MVYGLVWLTMVNYGELVLFCDRKIGRKPIFDYIAYWRIEHDMTIVMGCAEPSGN